MSPLKRISAVVITCNEEEKIDRALASLRDVVDEIVVVDSGSQDRTVEISRRFTDRVVHRPWQGSRLQKQFATDQASCEWVLSVDADEVVSPELGEEISQWRTEPTDCDGYWIPRMTFFLGRWIEHTDWYPDWQLRLFRKTAGAWEGGRVHESFRLQGHAGRLRGHLHHYTYTSVSEYLWQLDRFSGLAAADLFDRGERAVFVRLLIAPPLVFLRNYVLKRGFLDGTPGLAVSVLSAVSTFFKHLRLWEKQHSGASEAGR
jgi:glycosyltransferase involved in cell wall biosynthesis